MNENIYKTIYADPAHANYGRGTFRCRDFLPRIWDARLNAVCSLGCGSGDELFALAAEIPYCIGIDIALPSHIFCLTRDRAVIRHQDDITKLSLLPFTVPIDAVVSFDVLEHIPMDALDLVLSNARKIAPLACFAIANMPDQHRMPDGSLEELHLIQRPPNWWMERIARITGWSVELHRLPYPERFGIWCGEWP